MSDFTNRNARAATPQGGGNPNWRVLFLELRDLAAAWPAWWAAGAKCGACDRVPVSGFRAAALVLAGIGAELNTHAPTVDCLSPRGRRLLALVVRADGSASGTVTLGAREVRQLRELGAWIDPRPAKIGAPRRPVAVRRRRRLAPSR